MGTTKTHVAKMERRSRRCGAKLDGLGATKADPGTKSKVDPRKPIRDPVVLAVVAMLLSVGLMGCEDVWETKDNMDSQLTCHYYCAKRFACLTHDPTRNETDVCVSYCRTSIENDCGTEHQADANAKIEECVDKGCAEFWDCMVFDDAPECFGFFYH